MSNRLGIVYTVNEVGTARLLFTADRTAFEGVLETSDGESISMNGRLVKGFPMPTTSDETLVMGIILVVDEAGSSFKVDNVTIRFEDDKIFMENPTISFTSGTRLNGIKAEVEIRRWLRPDLVHSSNVMYIGQMKIQLLASHRPVPAQRRVSQCEFGPGDIPVLEQSEDFLA